MATGRWIIPVLLLLCMVQASGAPTAAPATSPAANAAALSPPDIGLQTLVRPLRLNNESFSASAAPISDGRWAYLVYINATPAAMAVAEQKEDGTYTAKLLTQEYEIRPILQAYYAAIGYVELARKELQAAHNIAQQMDAKEVDDCRQMMGIDSHECNSYDSCFSACRTSPTCGPLAEGAGKSFVYQLWDYNNRSKTMVDALAGEEKQYEAAEADIGLLSISKYKSSLSAVWAARDGLLSHPYNGWVCKTPFYDSAAPNNIRQHLGAAEARIIAMQGDDDAAKKISDEAARRMELKSSSLLTMNALLGSWGGNLLLLGAIGFGAVLLAGVVLVVMRNRKKRAGKEKAGVDCKARAKNV